MERNTQRNGLVNLMILLVIVVAGNDFDGDGYVELPMASDPAAADAGSVTADEADKATVLMVTITHELGHALAGGTHTKVAECLMHETAIDWRIERANYLSDHFRSLLRVHNKNR